MISFNAAPQVEIERLALRCCLVGCSWLHRYLILLLLLVAQELLGTGDPPCVVVRVARHFDLSSILRLESWLLMGCRIALIFIIVLETLLRFPLRLGFLPISLFNTCSHHDHRSAHSATRPTTLVSDSAACGRVRHLVFGAVVHRISCCSRLIIEQIIVARLVVGRGRHLRTGRVVDDGGCRIGNATSGLLSPSRVGLVLLLLRRKGRILLRCRLVLVPGLRRQRGSVPGRRRLRLLAQLRLVFRFVRGTTDLHHSLKMRGGWWLHRQSLSRREYLQVARLVVAASIGSALGDLHFSIYVVL